MTSTEITSSQLEDLLQHFDLIQAYIQRQQSEILTHRDYLITRSRQNRFRTDINEELDALFTHARSWSDTGLQQSYLGGWSGIFQGDPYTVSPQALANLQAIRSQFQGRLDEIQSFTKRDTTRFLRDMRNLGDEQVSVSNFDGRHGIKGVEQTYNLQQAAGGVTRHYRMSTFAKQLTRTANQRAFNEGTLDALKSKGHKYAECVDGFDCGWTAHNDPDKANGKIVTLEEARANPIAHPNCVRTFVETKKTPEDGRTKSDRSRVAAIAKQVAAAAAVGLVARSLFEVTEEIIDPEVAARYASAARFNNVYKRTWIKLDAQFAKIRGAEGEVIPFYLDPLPPEPQALPLAVGEGRTLTESFSASYGSSPNIEDWSNAALQWGDAIMDKRITLPQLPDWFRKSIHALDSYSENAVREKIMLFSRWVHGNRVSSRTLDEFTNVLQFELKRRQWNDFVILKQYDQLRSAVSATFTKYGPRTRIDASQFLRGKITFTKSGIRRSITFAPSSPVRSMLALSQDGTLMGAIRLVPNSIFRAIIETDEFGKITGNVRLVPKNFPFKVILRFETPRPRDWEYLGLTPGKDFVDLRAAATAARGFSLEDFSMREVYSTLRQMQLKDIEFQINILKNTPLQISASTKLPLRTVKEALARLEQTGFIYRDGEGWSGLFSWKPTFAAKEELQKIIVASEQKIMGGIQYSILKTRWLDIKPKLSTAAYFDNLTFREVLTSFRISGLTAINQARNLEIFSEILNLPNWAWEQYKTAANEVDARILLFMRRFNLANPREISDEFTRRFFQLSENFPHLSTADIYQGTLNAILGVRDENVAQLARKRHKIVQGGRTHQKWLKILAGIGDNDSVQVKTVKLQDMIFFMRALKLDSPELVEYLDQIDDQTIRLAARNL